MLYLLMGSDIKVDHFECSDLNESLIGIWNMIKDSPDDLFSFYKSAWPFEKDQYYEMRAQFNKDQDPKKFFCLLRSCRNGLVRYNLKGEFTSAFHLRRKGIDPDKLGLVVQEWSYRINKNNVSFHVRDYRDIKSSDGDYVYLDPPYAFRGEFYYGMIDFKELWSWLRQQPSYSLSLNGFKNDEDCTVQVPEELYEQHVFIDNGKNKFDQLVGNSVWARDSLYVKG